jgi:hypothetical protein
MKGKPLMPIGSLYYFNLKFYFATGDTDKFYLNLFGSLAMIHVIDAVLDSFSDLFQSHRYSPLEKIYSVILFTAGLSLRDLSERLCLTGASRESVRIMVHRFFIVIQTIKES